MLEGLFSSAGHFARDLSDIDSNRSSRFSTTIPLGMTE
jgi:hypothetical protein